jgi:hypothetical protein
MRLSFHIVSPLLASLFVLGVSRAAAAHVDFTEPAPDAVLTAGSTVTVTWVDVIVHDTQAYDLDFISDAAATPESIAHGLSARTHSYEWQVPYVECTDCALYVLQDNATYTDFSATLPISIVEGPAGGGSTSEPGISPSASAGSAGDPASSQSSASSSDSSGCTLSSGSQTGKAGLAWLALGAGLLGWRGRRAAGDRSGAKRHSR